jgi:hypothetical protein
MFRLCPQTKILIIRFYSTLVDIRRHCDPIMSGSGTDGVMSSGESSNRADLDGGNLMGDADSALVPDRRGKTRVASLSGLPRFLTERSCRGETARPFLLRQSPQSRLGGHSAFSNLVGDQCHHPQACKGRSKHAELERQRIVPVDDAVVARGQR